MTLFLQHAIHIGLHLHLLRDIGLLEGNWDRTVQGIYHSQVSAPRLHCMLPHSITSSTLMPVIVMVLPHLAISVRLVMLIIVDTSTIVVLFTQLVLVFTQIQVNATPTPAHRVAIVWWPGDHGNIGGGSTQSLNISQNTFLFMTQELQAAGFRLDPGTIRAFTDVKIGERQELQNSYSATTYGALGGRKFREPLPIHTISRMARMWEEYTLLSEEGIQQLLTPIFNPPEAQASQQGGYVWTTKQSRHTVREWAGPNGDGNDGLKPVSALTSQDESREGQGPLTGFAGQGRTIGQDPEQDDNITTIGPNVPHEDSHAPTQLHH